MHVEIALTRALQRRHALAANAEGGPGLRAFRHLELVLAAIESGNHDFIPKRGLGEGDRHGAVQVLAFTLKEWVRLDFQNNVKIAGRTAVDAGIALLLIADARGVFYARGNVHVNRALLHDAAITLALGAWIRDHSPQSLA